MKNKCQIIKYIEDQIGNLRCAMVDSDLDKSFPDDIRDKIVDGYKKRIEALESICVELNDLLM